MSVLTEAEIIEIIREEYEKQLSENLEAIVTLPNGDSKIVIDNETRVVHDSGFEYTVDSVSPRAAVLRSPEGKFITIPIDEFEAQYSVD